MIEVILNNRSSKEDFESWIDMYVDVNELDNRPYIKNFYFLQLNQIVHNWLESENIYYSLSLKQVGGWSKMVVNFENKSDAMFFKLRWF